MTKTTEPAGAHQNTEGNSEPSIEEKLEKAQKEAEELRTKADVSSQNYERAKKAETRVKELEAELEARNNEGGDPVESDEGRALKKEIAESKARQAALEEQIAFDKVASQHPALVERKDDFDEWREQYPGVSMDRLAKLYLNEKGLDEKPPVQRPGVERQSSSREGPPATGGTFTAEEAARLRDSDPKRYAEMIRSGELTSEKIQSAPQQ